MYDWLKNEKAPRILVEAVKLLGVVEAPGSVDNPVIMEWGKKVGKARLGMSYSADSIPWCGLFMAVCAVNAGLEPPPIAVRALAWSGWGQPVQRPALGDVLVFTRKGGGHVGLYVGEDAQAYHVLGGNQGDKVCVTRIAKARLYSASRTKWSFRQPDNVRLIWLDQSGALSENEV
jgi:uncharacterized protein (TIGR02594 family)